jgi:O-antigen ligase
MGRLTEVLAKLSLGASLAAVLASAQLTELCIVLLGVAALLVGLRICSSTRLSAACAYTCGLLLPTVPCLGDSVLIALVLIYVLMSRARDGAYDTSSSRWAMPLLAYVGGSLLIEVALAFDVGGAGTTSFLRDVTVDTPARAIDVWRELSQTHAHSWRWYARFLAFAYAVDFFASEVRYREQFLKGLVVGVVCAAVFALVQWFELLPFSVKNQTNFWTSINRVSGLSSDPNAMGIVMALSLWCLAWRALELRRGFRALDIGSILLIGAAGVVSGSRTFLLASGILAAALMWHYARRFFLLAILGAALAVCVVTVLDSSTVALKRIQESQDIPEGLKRGVSALSLLRVSQTVSSRSLFLEIAGVLVQGHTTFGVGADRFREYVPLVGVQSGLVKGWTDNANNLYVGIWAELGIVGLVLLFLVVAGRTRSTVGQSPLATALLCGLGLLMLTGPHTDFPEVMLLVAFLVGASTIQRSNNRTPSLVIAGALLLGAYASLTREQGVFTWDDTQRSAIRWLSNRARIQLACQPQEGDAPPYAVTSLRSVYVPQKGPLEVRVLRNSRVEQELSFTRPQELRELRVACLKKERQVTLTLVTRPAWSPYRAWPESSGDRRLLGVEQLVPRRT